MLDVGFRMAEFLERVEMNLKGRYMNRRRQKYIRKWNREV